MGRWKEAHCKNRLFSMSRNGGVFHEHRRHRFLIITRRLTA
ncbi:MAG: hypothetical protein OJF47_002769 [Nitrospira sp.]|nr:MAG: hypothetical protein OJF47_002769 [Nitrospira sp.]